MPGSKSRSPSKKRSPSKSKRNYTGAPTTDEINRATTPELRRMLYKQKHPILHQLNKAFGRDKYGGKKTSNNRKSKKARATRRAHK